MSEWLPMDSAPRDGTSFKVPPDEGYTHCFYQDGHWWWHNVNEKGESKHNYAAGPEPTGWQPMEQA